MAEFVVPPVLEQQRGLWRHAPVPRVGDVAPLVDVPANFVYGGGSIVLLLCRGNTLSFVKDQLLLASTARPCPLPRLGNGVMNSAPRRLSMTCWVGCPVSSSSQCR